MTSSSQLCIFPWDSPMDPVLLTAEGMVKSRPWLGSGEDQTLSVWGFLHSHRCSPYLPPSLANPNITCARNLCARIKLFPKWENITMDLFWKSRPDVERASVISHICELSLKKKRQIESMFSLAKLEKTYLMGILLC